MSERIITLFGEEIIPEQSKKGGKKKNVDKAENAAEAPPRIPDLPQQPVAAPVAMLFDTPATAPKKVEIETPSAAANVETELATDTEIPGQSLAEETKVQAEIAEEIEAAEPIVTAAEEQYEVTVMEAPAVVDEPTDQLQLPKEDNEAAEETHESEIQQLIIPTPKADSLELPNDGKKYYTIGEVSEMFGLKTSNIRFWTNEFKIKVRTTRKGDRLYTPEQVKELKAIYHLVKDRGFTLQGAKEKLKEQKNLDVSTIDLKESLKALKEKLVSIKNQMK
jgi:DNA-binding transcriptional MerR regulator